MFNAAGRYGPLYTVVVLMDGLLKSCGIYHPNEFQAAKEYAEFMNDMRQEQPPEKRPEHVYIFQDETYGEDSGIIYHNGEWFQLEPIDT